MNRRIAIAVLTTLVATIAGPVATAAAFPSDRDLERAREAERVAGDAAADTERRLAALVVRTDELAETAARAAEVYNGARFALAEAEAAEREAADQARRAARVAEQAHTDLGRVAAATYRSGGQFASLGLVLEAAGTEHFLDGAAALRTVTRSQGVAYRRAADASAVAEHAAADAEKALAGREAAARAAERASADAAARVAAQESQLAAAEQEREALLAELAAARGTTVALEEERQAAVEAAAAAERERRARRQAEREQEAASPDPAADRGDDGGGSTDEPTGGATGSAPPDDRTSAPDAEPAPATTSPPTPRPASTTSAPAPVPPRSPSPSASPTSSSPAPVKPSPTATGAPAPPAVNVSAAERAIAYARAQLGKPYQWGGAGPDTFDCSGLTMRAWQQGGKQLPHWSVAQAREVSRVSYADLRPGDLIFWSDDGQASGTYHVALYVGGGQMIHAPRPGKNVEVQSVFYWRTPSFYGRV